MGSVLVLGGYGVFGQRAAERLARRAGLEVIVAGRDGQKAAATAGALAREGAGLVKGIALDARTIRGSDLTALGVDVVVNTAGPFQGQDYRVARAAIAAGAHYIDLADARAFVAGIATLDREAREAGVLVVSGASSVPALAAAVLDGWVAEGLLPVGIRYAISPGNSFDPGLATTASVLGGVGRPFQRLAGGAMITARGWQPLVRADFGAAGRRWVGASDVPDLDLFPARYPSLRSQLFLAGVEVGAFHLGLYALSWLVRAGLVPAPQRLAGPLLGLKARLGFLGSDRGAMLVEARGCAADGRRWGRRWSMVACRGHGPYVPATPAVILAARLAAGEERQRGAMPALGLMTLAAFTAEVADLAISQSVVEVPTPEVEG